MRAINHALTGALIGLTVSNPVLAMPAAFLSHYVCDIIPHFGSNGDDGVLKTRWFAYSLIIDAALCGLLVLLLAVSQPAQWLSAAVCAFLAAAPDLDWVKKFVAIRRGKTYSYSRYEQFAADIQWFEKPIGAVVEAAWFIGVGYLVLLFV